MQLSELQIYIYMEKKKKLSQDLCSPPQCLDTLGKPRSPNDRHTEFFALESRFAPVINLSPELI